MRRLKTSTRFAGLIAVLVLATGITAASALAVASQAGKSPRSGALHITKECSQNNGQAGDFCTITSSNVKAITVGSRIFYLQAAGSTSLDSDIVVVVGTGNYALGHVTLDFATGTGEVRISGGKGQFTSFHAKAAVSALGGPNFAWDGKYRFGRDDD